MIQNSDKRLKREVGTLREQMEIVQNGWCPEPLDDDFRERFLETCKVDAHFCRQFSAIVRQQVREGENG